MTERRHFIRILYQAPAELQQGTRVWTAEVRDLSLQGVLLTCPPDWAPEADTTTDPTYRVRFTLHDSDITLTMDTRLVHHDSHYLRLQIHHFDIDSVSHLKRLVELNVGTDTLLKRELEHLADLHNP
ncbi:PilZ domain-containing protein [Photobacterium sp. TY1-4]|uniref:PilZ domain-containing protein n=1 Tax=Photobacterium sp. TY1-4 TaxID=2899122 RepID=UPI0021BE9818|nr:PilZ domain-containing protein [Photobacterium sp. TY1-4]UXI00785.1 PilZ domain-containing protein [Photobacterium sp. TY1-4]